MSSSSTAPSSSTPASTSFPAEMVGRDVKLFLPYREGNISEVKRRLEKKQTVISIEASGPISPSKNWRFEAGGLRFEGVVDTGESSATILVDDAAVLSCRCCMETGVPYPPFSSRIKGMKVRFAESDPNPTEATILKVEKRPTLSDILLKMTSLPPYSASIGDKIMLRSGLNTWEATVMYFGDEDYGVTGLENRISIHVLDEHVPQGPICLPHTKINVRPAPSGPAHISINRKGKGDSQRKRKFSGYGENEVNQKKIKVAINGYRDIGKALARVALDSEYVDLVAINDPSITDQVSCMFRDSKCDFEVKNSSSGILLFGEKEVDFFQESDPTKVPWYLATPKLVVTSSNSSQADYLESASQYNRIPDHKLTGPLERMLGISTAEANAWSPIFTIRAISSSDAKAVSECFPLWNGKRIASVFRFQGTEVIFELGAYPDYESLPNSTRPSVDLSQIVRWCFHMLRRIQTAVCDVEISEGPREVERRLEKKQTVISIEASGPISPSKNWRFEAGGLRFEGVVDTGESSATILVDDAAVWSCRCCMETGVPYPPFSSRIKGMKVRFSESDTHPTEATILKVEKRPTLSGILLKMTSLPPYYASIGDKIMLRSGLNTWEATVMYFGDEDCGVTGLETRISIHVLDEHVPQGPICLPNTKINVRPAPSGPAHIAINRKGKGDSLRKRKFSAYGENEVNQKKIKVAINGYRDIGKALARVALESEDVDLVAINDPSITDHLEILGTGVDSICIDPPGHVDEYIYKNFQQPSLSRFISSWRKRPFNKIHIIPPPRLQLPGECALHATLALMECHFKVWYARHGSREFTVRLSHLHLGNMVREFLESKDGKRFKGRDKLKVCLLMAKLYGVLSEEDFAAGCPPKAVRYKIEEYYELSDNDMETIPSLLKEAEMVLTSFRVTEEYRLTLPHDIYRYQAPEKPGDVHEAHCVVLTSSAFEFKDREMAADEAEAEPPEWERYYEYLNSYNGWGIDGCGYVYHDSLRRSYRITVVNPEI